LRDAYREKRPSIYIVDNSISLHKLKGATNFALLFNFYPKHFRDQIVIFSPLNLVRLRVKPSG
jgi:hypothetical protein